MIPHEITKLTRIGWHVFPVSRYTKRTPFKGAKEQATTDHRLIEEWCYEYPGCNWRAHPGKSGILCLDIDRAGDLHECDGFSTMQRLTEKHGKLPRGPRLKTGGSGGLVAFFRWRGQELRGGPGALGPGIDVSTERGAACPTLPPSIHQHSGNPYVWLRAPWDISPPELPEWICDALKPLPVPKFDPVEISDDQACRMLGYYAQDIRNAGSGGSNRTLYGSAFKAGKLVGSSKIGYNEALTLLRSAAYERIKPDDRGSIMPTIHSGLRSGMRAV